MFLYIARGSAGETRSALIFASERPELTDLRPRCRELIAQAESVSRQIGAWAESLQNSDIAGPRHLTDQSRLEYDHRRRSAEFLEKLRQMCPVPQPPAGKGQSEDE